MFGNGVDENNNYDKSMIFGNGNNGGGGSTMGTSGTNAIQNNLNSVKESKLISLNTNCLSCSGNSSVRLSNLLNLLYSLL